MPPSSVAHTFLFCKQEVCPWHCARAQDHSLCVPLREPRIPLTKHRCVLDVCVVALDYVTLANVLAEDGGADFSVLRFARILAFSISNPLLLLLFSLWYSVLYWDFSI